MDSTPQLDATLDQLVQHCGEVLAGEAEYNDQRVEALTKNLSTNGWERHTEDQPPLSVVLKERVRETFREPAIHRGAEIDGIVLKVQRAYNEASRMHASHPGDDDDKPSAMPPRTLG